MTLALPVLAILGIGIGQLMSTSVEPPEVKTTTIGYIDEIGGFDQYTAHGKIELIRFDTQEDATVAMIKNDIKEYFVIPLAYTSNGIINRYTLEKELETSSATRTAIKNFLTSNLLSGKVPPDTVNLIETPLRLAVIRLTETGSVATEQGGFGNVIIPGIFSCLLALSLMFSSSHLIQGMGEEKESRLIEVLLSSVSPRQLLIGKLLGLGVAGLLQVGVWLASISFELGFIHLRWCS
jgi:ABC-2 type transport system permease protein